MDVKMLEPCGPVGDEPSRDVGDKVNIIIFDWDEEVEL
jgi:hypothetical protein